LEETRPWLPWGATPLPTVKPLPSLANAGGAVEGHEEQSGVHERARRQRRRLQAGIIETRCLLSDATWSMNTVLSPPFRLVAWNEIVLIARRGREALMSPNGTYDVVPRLLNEPNRFAVKQDLKCLITG